MGFFQTFPGGGEGANPNTLRVNITAFKTEKQNLNPKEANHIVVGAPVYDWSMIAPTDIQENISHTWEEYHSVQGRVAEVVRDVTVSGQKLLNAAQGGLGRAGGTTAGGLVKVDSPMVYTGSERREYSFTFPMMQHRDIANDVANPINEFRKYSCASIDDIGADTIEFPCTFEIQTWPVPFIFIKYSILSNVQVTYNAPFKQGYPQRAELTLTFKDIRPLYQSSWDETTDAKINARVKNQALAQIARQVAGGRGL